MQLELKKQEIYPTPSILSYDEDNSEFFMELIYRLNEKFRGTKVEIPLIDKKGNSLTGEVEHMNILHRMAIFSTIFGNLSLRQYHLLPITPAQSEYFIKNKKLKNSCHNYEDLALLLYDTNPQGVNSEESQALKEEISRHRIELCLSNSHLEERLVIINAGIEKDSSMPHGLKPIVIPEVTLVYPHEILNETEKSYTFEYALEDGLPLLSQTGIGERILTLPKEKYPGLRTLFRSEEKYLHAWYKFFDSGYRNGRVYFSAEE